jgi:hypothetical protein
MSNCADRRQTASWSRRAATGADQLSADTRSNHDIECVLNLFIPSLVHILLTYKDGRRTCVLIWKFTQDSRRTAILVWFSASCEHVSHSKKCSALPSTCGEVSKIWFSASQANTEAPLNCTQQAAGHGCIIVGRWHIGQQVKCPCRVWVTL